MKIHSIFDSISGEGGFIPQGSWCTFIRFQQCNLKCRWCDTVSAQDKKGGKDLSVDEIVEQISSKRIIITGGEPLLQMESFLGLIIRLLDLKKIVQVETNGSYIPPFGMVGAMTQYVSWVVDYKCPSSGMSMHMSPVPQFTKKWRTLPAIVKFVVDFDSECDLSFAIESMEGMLANAYNQYFLISPLDAKGQKIQNIVSEITMRGKASLLDRIVFSVQLHKIVNLP